MRRRGCRMHSRKRLTVRAICRPTILLKWILKMRSCQLILMVLLDRRFISKLKTIYLLKVSRPISPAEEAEQEGEVNRQVKHLYQRNKILIKSQMSALIEVQNDICLKVQIPISMILLPIVWKKKVTILQFDKQIISKLKIKKFWNEKVCTCLPKKKNLKSLVMLTQVSFLPFNLALTMPIPSFIRPATTSIWIRQLMVQEILPQTWLNTKWLIKWWQLAMNSSKEIQTKTSILASLLYSKEIMQKKTKQWNLTSILITNYQVETLNRAWLSSIKAPWNQMQSTKPINLTLITSIRSYNNN